MELRDYLRLLWNWAWLLILGLLVGLVGGYAFGWYQPPEYEAVTTVMIVRPAQTDLSDLASLSDQQLAQTYGQLLLTRAVLQAAEKQLGYSLDTGQISLQFVDDTLLLRVAVRDNEAGRAANNANALIQAFVSQTEVLQTGRYAEAEAKLQLQIEQVEQQIATTQAEIADTAQSGLALQRAIVSEQIVSVEQQITDLQSELVRLEASFELSNAPLLLTPPPARPTPKVEDRVEIEQLRGRLEQLRNLLSLYQAAQVSLAVQSDTLGLSQTSVTGELQSALALYQQIHAGLLNDFAELRLARLRAAPVVTQVEPAVPPHQSLALDPLLVALAGGLVGLALAATFVFLREYLDDTLRTAAQLAEGFQLPVLGSLPTLSRAARTASFITSRVSADGAEAVRSLRANLDFSQASRPWSTLLVTSPNPAEGKTTVAANLAWAWVNARRTVLLMDADLRSPRVHRLLNRPNRLGLTDVLNGTHTLDEVLQAGPEPGLLVLPSGPLPTNPAELLGSDQMSRLLLEAHARAELVVVDGPPLMTADGLLLAARVDSVLLTTLPGRTALVSARAIRDQLERAGAHLLGLVVNRAVDRRTGGYYGPGGYRLPDTMPGSAKSLDHPVLAPDRSDTRKARLSTAVVLPIEMEDHAEAAAAAADLSSEYY